MLRNLDYNILFSPIHCNTCSVIPKPPLTYSCRSRIFKASQTHPSADDRNVLCRLPGEIFGLGSLSESVGGQHLPATRHPCLSGGLSASWYGISRAHGVSGYIRPTVLPRRMKRVISYDCATTAVQALPSYLILKNCCWVLTWFLLLHQEELHRNSSDPDSGKSCTVSSEIYIACGELRRVVN